MTDLETRAEIIADSTGGRTRGTSRWLLLRKVALGELRQAVAEAEDALGVADEPIPGRRDGLVRGS